MTQLAPTSPSQRAIIAVAVNERSRPQNAWKGRGRHQRNLAEWLWATHLQCPAWRRQWARALRDMKIKGEASYRGLLMDVKHKAFSHMAGQTGKKLAFDSANRELFLACHQDLLALAASLTQFSQGAPVEQETLGQLLRAQWPTDQAWDRAVRHRLAMVEAAAKSQPRTRGLDRLLTQRRNSLVLTKGKDNQWRTIRGGSLKRVLESSGPVRRRTIQALTSLPGLDRLELPRELDFAVLGIVTRKIKSALSSDHPTVVEAKEKSRPWRLAVRRIQGMGLHGCFDAAGQTVVVDPRHLASIKHELCHWLLGHDVALRRAAGGSREEQEVHSLERELWTDFSRLEKIRIISEVVTTS